VFEWRFADGPDAGRVWTARPSDHSIYVDYRNPAGTQPDQWMRLLVGTRSWVLKQLEGVQYQAKGPLSLALPRMLVIPDVDPGQALECVETILRRGGLDHFSNPVGAGSAPSEI
jgi:hypothetical protein